MWHNTEKKKKTQTWSQKTWIHKSLNIFGSDLLHIYFKVNNPFLPTSQNFCKGSEKAMVGDKSLPKYKALNYFTLIIYVFPTK